MRFLLWVVAILLTVAASVWPAFAVGLGQLVAITTMFLLAGVAHLLSQPPLLALATVAIVAVRLAHSGWRSQGRR
ncbi:hypothetical protein [Streptomyces sp. STR69]|uniref:hypothetical protein n=1 Tax=Streptomyces sp. STR69 TaxID=1796942 RepID=UPI0021C90A39|nr:hypothetical protein [Streptomyces sp. STR69]